MTPKGIRSRHFVQHSALSHSLADPHGLLVIRFEELKVLVGLHGLPAVLAHVEHFGWDRGGKGEIV